MNDIYRDDTTRVFRPMGRRGPVRTDVLPDRVGVLASCWGHWDAAGGMWGRFALLADGRVSFSRDSAAPWSQVTPYCASAVETRTEQRCRAAFGAEARYAEDLLRRLTQDSGRAYWARQRTLRRTR
jgi:hypothetical protein